ncbi:MAG: single-stranded-DNA-specific exonuclease RecJ [Bacteroidetes bacterium RIFCSPLOWO2_12_FULL_35_15]|nr:MAG: single-stranded-DNA-specific exonuclease RecJ [Bacteroidetes bacterium RIFCSPLOWO2_12_FULL_35_15]
MEKRWSIKTQAEETLVDQLANEVGIDKVLANLLIQRGVTSFETAKSFFRPSLSDLHDPFLMKDMDKAISRIEKAIKDHEKILVYGDYDVDGTTAVALVYSFFKKNIPPLSEELVDYYIPDRYAEGYGVSFQGIDFAKENNFTLIIALDCGIKANDKVDYANERNIDFIICDHHRPGEFLPNAVAVLDAKRNDCTYPFDELCGCGVGFKLIQAYAQKNNISFDKLTEYLDLTAISIASDLVPIVGENRTLCYFGIEQINKNPRKGIKAILDLANIKKEITMNELVFTVGPRINAAGRIETGRSAVKLLISDSHENAKTSGASINVTNTERRALDVTITQHALSMIDENDELISRKSTVLFHSDWHKGVIGIVASRLTEKYYRPTIILTESNGMATGSARSVKDFDVYNAIESCADLLEQFGGHKYAAGLTMKLENLEAFQKRFEEVVCETILDHMLIPEIEIDAELELHQITPKFFRILKQFAPFGPENMAPVFMSKGLMDKGYVRIVGNNHLKLDIQAAQNPREGFSAIAFGQSEHFDNVLRKNVFSACYAIEENEYNGNISLQLNVKDMKME